MKAYGQDLRDKVIKVYTEEKLSMNKGSSLLRSLVNVSGMTLVSRVLGFIRDMLSAQFFGAGIAMDAFVVAFRLPNLLRRIFAEGAFSQAFVPVLAEYKIKRDIQSTRQFVADIAGLLSLILTVIVILGVIFASTVVIITAPGFAHNSAKLELTSNLLKITFPYILFISLSSLISGVLNTWRIFIIPAFTPAILNISIIIFILCFRNYFNPPILALAWASIIGGILQLGFQLPYLKKIGMPLLPRFNLRDSAVWRVVKLMGPAIFAMSIAQVSIVINTIFTSWLPTGSMSWLFYADRLMEFPTGVLGVALGTILLPNLSKHVNENNIIIFSKTLDWGLRLCLLLALPAAVGLAIIAKPLTMTLFMRGKFGLFDVTMTSHAMIAYAIGLLGLLLVKVLAPGFYANQNIKTPVKIALFVLFCTQIMNLIFIGPFKHAGLALAISLGACINAGCLGYLLIKRKMYIPQSGWGVFLMKILFAVIIMASCICCGMHFLPLDFMGHIYVRISSLVILLLIAALSYFTSLYLFGLRVAHYRILE